MRHLFLVMIVIAFNSCADCGEPIKVEPIFSTWDDAFGKLLPEMYLNKKEGRQWLDGNFINPNLSISVYKCSENLFVIIEEDWNSSLNALEEPVKFFNNIYIFDSGVLTSTSYPQGYNHKVFRRGSEVYISLSYFYRSEFKVHIGYINGKIVDVPER